MRIYDERYTRDLRRYDLAWRLIGHEARTEIISRLTGLAPIQIRSLYRAYAGYGGSRPHRLRGSAPQSLDYFLSSRPIHDEASAVASWCAMIGLVPSDLLQSKDVDEWGLEQAEKLCSVFELYRAMPRDSRRLPFSIEHLLLLVIALGRQEKILLGNCEQCGAYLIVEQSVAGPKECASCSANGSELTGKAQSAASDQSEIREGVQGELTESSGVIQWSLF